MRPHSETELEEGTSYLPDHGDRYVHSLQVFQGKMNFLNVANGLQLPFVRVSQKQSSHWFERTDGCDRCSRHASASVQKVRDQGVADSEPGIRTDGKAGAGFRVLSTVTEFQVNQPVT